MFEQLDVAPPDAILGLSEAFAKDTNPKKVNMGVGVYKDAAGKTPILATVKEAEARLLKSETTKGYLPIDGSPAYGNAVQEMVFGAGHEVLQSRRCATAHTPGGTAALRVAADFVKAKMPGAKIWSGDPTWANHPQIFAAAGLEQKVYPYYDAAGKCLNFAGMMEALANIPRGDVVLLHGCCHNPTGMDPDQAQWKVIAACAKEKGWLPLIDFAYQGFADGIREDASGLMEFLSPGQELLICSSFSKNFGLYNERTGALTVVAGSEDGAQKAMGHIKRVIRVIYSNPPSHGGAIVATILNDASLRKEWEAEVAGMRERIKGMRHLLVDTLHGLGVKQDFTFITRQSGMFSFSGLDAAQVAALRETYGVYIVGGGRINVAGMTESNAGYLCQSIADVLRG